MENYLKLQPAKGKYLKLTSNGKTYEIFKVDPRTNEFGTRIGRQEAILLLENFPNLISLVQQVKDGKIVSQISKQEIAEIRQNQFNRQLGLKTTATAPAGDGKAYDAEISELKGLLAQQSELIKSQAEAIESLKGQIEAMASDETPTPQGGAD